MKLFFVHLLLVSGLVDVLSMNIHSNKKQVPANPLNIKDCLINYEHIENFKNVKHVSAADPLPSYSSSIRGNRSTNKENQDTEIHYRFLIGDRVIDFLGIFDGHGDHGKKASSFVARFIGDFLILYLQKDDQDLETSLGCSFLALHEFIRFYGIQVYNQFLVTKSDLEEIEKDITVNFSTDDSKIEHLVNFFAESVVLDHFKNILAEVQQDLKGFCEIMQQSGSTGVGVLIDAGNGQITSVNYGDSMAIMFDNNGNVIELTREQKAKDKDAVTYMKKKLHLFILADDFVENISQGRMPKSNLGTARAFGDVGKGNILMIPYPEVRSFNFKLGHHVFLACDGVWDVFYPNEISQQWIEYMKYPTMNELESNLNSRSKTITSYINGKKKHLTDGSKLKEISQETIFKLKTGQELKKEGDDEIILNILNFVFGREITHVKVFDNLGELYIDQDGDIGEIASFPWYIIRFAYTLGSTDNISAILYTPAIITVEKKRSIFDSTSNFFKKKSQ